MGSRTHRTGPENQFTNTSLSNSNTEPVSNYVSCTGLCSVTNTQSITFCPMNAVSTVGTSASTTTGAHLQTGLLGSTSTNCTNLNNEVGSHYQNKTREQVRFFYQQTWQKIRRYIKFPDEVPQHVREVYALVNYSVLRARIKKRRLI